MKSCRTCLVDKFILFLLKMKGGEDMMAMFVAQRIILGKADFKTSPELLKPQVAEILRESGLEELIIE